MFLFLKQNNNLFFIRCFKSAGFYAVLYDKFKVNKNQVRNSFKYYHSNPKEMSQYYQWIIDSLRQKVYELNGPLDK